MLSRSATTFNASGFLPRPIVAASTRQSNLKRHAYECKILSQNSYNKTLYRKQIMKNEKKL
jgi:hypothetical protein